MTNVSRATFIIEQYSDNLPRPTCPTRPDRRHADGTTSTGRIDLYRKGCFVCETKRGVEARRNKSDSSRWQQALASKGT